MNHEILMVSYRRDFRYLKYCLRSISKFASGFTSRLIVPNRDFAEAVELVRQHNPATAVASGDEWSGKGMLWHMYVIMYSDEWCPTADVVLHVDSDCVFTEPVTPEDYMVNGKPLMLYESFASLGPKHSEVLKWQQCTRNNLPWEPLYETMRRHPEVYCRRLYPRARAMMQQKTGKTVEEYLKGCENTFPQNFCEHVTLGNVAIHEFPDDYEFYDLSVKPWPPNKLRQAWSHREPTAEDMELFRKLGIE